MPPKKLGRYLLDRKIATGGMAEIWLAHQEGPAGFEKQLVVKRILPHLAEDPKFVEMFLDEARLAARLTHANIAQIFDLGEADGEYFIAMEFVDGRDMQAVVDRSIEVGHPIPPVVAVRIVADACVALDYAHNFVDRDGTPVQLVHRDISPQNILLSRDGVVKLVDFGVAKAATSTHKTQTGAVKGKLSYMAPEQIGGQRVDARTDIFALGIVLYELVTGRRPFGHESELLAITAILNEQPPRPCTLVHDLPADIETVILRALEKRPDDRYQSASELHIALEQLLRGWNSLLTSRDLRLWLDDLFSAHPTGALSPLAAASGAAYVPAGLVTQVDHPSAVTRPGFSPPGEADTEPSVRLRGALAGATEPDTAPPPVSHRRGVAAPLALLAIVVVAVGAALAWFATRAPVTASTNTTPTTATPPAEIAQAGSDEHSVASPTTHADDDRADSEGSARAATADDAAAAPGEHDGSGAGSGGPGPGLGVVDGSGGGTQDAAPADAPAPDALDGSAPADVGEATTAHDDVAAAASPDTAPEPPSPPSADAGQATPPPPRPSTGSVRIVVSGGSHTVFIDGRRVGSLPGAGRFTVSPGRHTIRLERQGGASTSRTVDVDPGENEVVRIGSY
ncbi:MAG: serine/threonine protein kinase [Myxococcales bacterium]|nr:serine/threonine protein kinase [Myxococcales bacterium]